MTLYDIIKSNSNGKGEGLMWSSVELISKFVDEHMDESDKDKLMCKVFGLMSGGHYNEEFAEKQISKMYYQDKGGRKHKAPYWSEEEVEDIYEEIKSRIPSYNLYDFIVTMNMKGSDEWYLIHSWFPDITPDQFTKKVAESALNWLMDEDWPTKSKIWDYFNK